MDVKSTIAAIPWLRRAWKVVPGPFRIPLLVLGALYWLYTRAKGDDPTQSEAAGHPEG